jgi:hypothetical protein
MVCCGLGNKTQQLGGEHIDLSFFYGKVCPNNR